MPPIAWPPMEASAVPPAAARPADLNGSRVRSDAVLTGAAKVAETAPEGDVRLVVLVGGKPGCTRSGEVWCE